MPDPVDVTDGALVPAPAAPTPSPFIPSTPILPDPSVLQPGMSASAGYHAITPGGLAITGQLNSAADKQAAADYNRFVPTWQAEGAEADRIAQERHAASIQQRQAEMAHFDREQQFWRDQQSIQHETAALEQHAYAQSQAVRSHYMANYERDLMAARALAMQSGDPYQNMSGGEALGLIAQAAVAGFLKVGGHDLGIAEQTDRWVNREIAKHQQRVVNAQNAADSTLHLYDLARQNSRDDYEARERFRGMVLEGLKAQVGAEASRYNSQMANVTAAQRQAEIDSHLLDVKSNLANRAQQAFYNFEKMRIEEASDRAKNSIGWYNAKTERQREDRLGKVDKSAPVLIPDPGATIRDPSGKVVGLQNGWQVDPNAPEGVKKDLASAGVEYAQIKASVAKLRELRPPAMGEFVVKYGPVLASHQFSEASRAYERQKTLAIMGVRHSIAGANLTDNEKKEWDNVLENDSGWQSGENSAALEQLEGQYRDGFMAKMTANPYVHALAPDQQSARGVSTLANDTDAAYDAKLRSKGAAPTPVEEAASEATKVGHNEVKLGGGFSPNFAEYMGETGKRGGVGRTSDREDAPGQRAEIDAVDHLVALVAKPEIGIEASTVNGKPTTDAETLRSAAFLKLNSIAEGSTKVDEEVRDYAKWMVDKIGKADDAEQLYQSAASRTHPGDPGTFEEQMKAREATKRRQRGELLRHGITGE